MVLSGFISSQAWDSVLDAFHVLSGFWFLITMKLNLKDLAAILLVPQVVLAAAQCPDYTSFSQVTCSFQYSSQPLTRALGAAWTRIYRATWSALYATYPGVSHF